MGSSARPFGPRHSPLWAPLHENTTQMSVRPRGPHLSSVENAPALIFSPVRCPTHGLGCAVLDSDHAECEMNTKWVTQLESFTRGTSGSVKPVFHLARHVSTQQVQLVERVEVSVSSTSRKACRAVLFNKLDTAIMQGLDMSNVSWRDVTSQVEFWLNKLELQLLTNYSLGFSRL